MKLKATSLFLGICLAALAVAASPASAATKQLWSPGWDIFTEPLNYSASYVTWSVAAKNLTVTFDLVDATPDKLYEVGVQIFCTTIPATFGRFPIENPVGGGTCPTITRQGITRTLAGVAFGVVTTDIHGNGSFKVVDSKIDPGTYEVEFFANDGAGCALTGGGSDCFIVFQSPGPTYGDTTTITIP